MSEKPASPTPEEVRTKAQAEKAKRLADALRHNLKRRKAAASPTSATDSSTPQDDVLKTTHKTVLP
ncbi:hypothetical protein Q1W73_17325 [Asticcacaulis sp. ZE23SCel15]|jgi:hypothetical protein|uniref:hypothetical protein n=1 Tax=Asticcacaulis sp. ZE23SCel15 TaxID=3059027 RepID=UPI00265F16D6|nr:hypothetical protein [Asticcacaulis sp. ZE23SCel15]WKL57403.1 hypothetical protein Q1W73_17325 [Asticcacaulis sp. ZE23SCel15]